jgi:hypothetical protein
MAFEGSRECASPDPDARAYNATQAPQEHPTWSLSSNPVVGDSKPTHYLRLHCWSGHPAARRQLGVTLSGERARFSDPGRPPEQTGR